MHSIALVTGANKGIGRAVAQELGKRGMYVLLGARDPKKGDEAAKALRAEGLDVAALTLDVADDSSVRAAAEQVAKDHAHLDILVNNAGVSLEFTPDAASPSTVSMEQLKATFETNFFGAFRTLRYFLPLLQKSSAGRVVNVSSSLGSLTLLTTPGTPFYDAKLLGYCASKTALNVLTVQFAKDLAQYGIKVNSVCPGWVKTDMGGPNAPRSVEQGAREIVRLATLPDDGPTGGYFEEGGVVAW